jgi:PEP-CTERM motif
MKISIRPLVSALALAGMLSPLSALAQSAPVGPSDLGTIGATGYTVAYGDTYTAPQTAVAPANLYSFTDAFTFTVPTSAAFSAFSATINLGNVLSIANFQAALFQGFGLASTFGGTGAGSHVGYAGPVGTAVNGLQWNAGNGSFITLTSNSLAAGNYTLAVRGHVNGTNGGSYSGVMNLAPVPEASTMALMLAGLAGIGLVLRRRHGGT